MDRIDCHTLAYSIDEVLNATLFTINRVSIFQLQMLISVIYFSVNIVAFVDRCPVTVDDSRGLIGGKRGSSPCVVGFKTRLPPRRITIEIDNVRRSRQLPQTRDGAPRSVVDVERPVRRLNRQCSTT